MTHKPSSEPKGMPAEASSISPRIKEPSCSTHEGTGPITPVVVVLDHLRSAFNVGNIFRLAEATQIEKIITCGYTATPPHPKIAKTARSCDERVASEHADSASAAIRKLRHRGYSIYAVETAVESTVLWDSTINFPAAFVLGNEALGVTAEAWAACDAGIKLPCFGMKNSVNVANCAAVVLFEAVRQHSIKPPNQPSY